MAQAMVHRELRQSRALERLSVRGRARKNCQVFNISWNTVKRVNVKWRKYDKAVTLRAESSSEIDENKRTQLAV